MLKIIHSLIITGIFLIPSIAMADLKTYFDDFIAMGTKYSTQLFHHEDETDTGPGIKITASRPSVYQGDCLTLSWEAPENSTGWVLEPNIGKVDPIGSLEITPTETTTFTFTTEIEGKTVAADYIVNVINPEISPTIEVAVQPANIVLGEKAVLKWTSSNAEHVYIDNSHGVVSLQGALVVMPNHSTTYHFTAVGPGGAVTHTSTLKVLVAPQPIPKNSFCKTHERLIPEDADMKAFNYDYFSIIKGKLKKKAGFPLKGVLVSVFGHPEYGTTLSDGDGQFQIPVESFNNCTLVFQKEGFFTSYKEIDNILPNTIRLIDTLTLGTQNPVSKTVLFDGNPHTVITHTVKQTLDNNLERTFRLVFTGDNQAYLADQDGNNVLPLDQIKVHLTLFESANESPGKSRSYDDLLFTHYELTGEGLPRLNFSKPVILWMENYLNHEVGKEMITSNFNPVEDDWEPEKSAVVVKLLDLNQDGKTDALDANGDGMPDDLNSNGSFEDEVVGLDDSDDYLPGKTLIRMEHLHFSTLKFNDYPSTRAKISYQFLMTYVLDVSHFLLFMSSFVY